MQGVERRIPQRDPDERITSELREVVEPDKRFDGLDQAPAVQGEVEREENRREREDRQERRGRRQESPRGERLTEAPWAGPLPRRPAERPKTQRPQQCQGDAQPQPDFRRCLRRRHREGEPPPGPHPHRHGRPPYAAPSLEAHHCIGAVTDGELTTGRHGTALTTTSDVSNRP